MAPLLIGMCFLGSVQIFFIGLVGEYVLTINSRVMHRPLVVEEERDQFRDMRKKAGVRAMKYKVDVVRIRENTIQLNGWAIGKTAGVPRWSLRWRTETTGRWSFSTCPPGGTT